MKRSDRVSSLIVIAISVVFFIMARDFSPLSGLFPRTILVILASLALLLFISTFIRKDKGESFDTAAFRHVPSLISLALIIAWGVIIPVIGFLVTSLVFFPLITVYLDRGVATKKLFGRIGIAVGLTVLFYLFFTQVLYVPFPEGILL